MHPKEIISVTGLGYVGLPVAVAFAKEFQVIGFDISEKRVENLKAGIDVTRELNIDEILGSKIEFTCNPEKLRKANFHIITVPTPIDDAHRPDLTLVIAASRTVGRQLKTGDIVVYESTVYPGLTEEVCLPILEQESNLSAIKDFKIGYSPERVNPGDKVHRFETITKIVAGIDEEALERVARVYGSVVGAGIHRTSSIKVAEAAKVIENTQRDLNVALINELSLIFHKMDIDTLEVLEAAGTKWNFLKFTPGLVGGHCIGVDPYYLTHKAEQVGHIPQVILAGRRVNDGMGSFIARETVKKLALKGTTLKNAVVTILGVTFKENCPDIRNSRVFDIISELKQYGIDVQAADPVASADNVYDEYKIRLTPFNELKPAEALVVAVSHETYKTMNFDVLLSLMTSTKMLIDVKGVFSRIECARNDIDIWRL